MRALRSLLMLVWLTGLASGATPRVVATDPMPAAAPRAPPLVRGLRYGPIGVGAAVIRWRDQTFVAAAYQLRLDLVLRSGVAIGAEARVAMAGDHDDGDALGVVSVLAVTSRDVGRVRLHAGVGPGWVSRGPGARFSRNGTASLGADVSLARAGAPMPTLWLGVRGEVATNGVYVASLGLRVDLDFLDP